MTLEMWYWKSRDWQQILSVHFSHNMSFISNCPSDSYCNFALNGCVSQESCLAPLLHIIYSSKLFDIVEHHFSNASCYANDSRLYLVFKLDESASWNDASTAMQNCINDIHPWMEYDKLVLNDDESEFLIIGSWQQLFKLFISSIREGNHVVGRSSVVRNLGLLSMTNWRWTAISTNFEMNHSVTFISFGN